MDDECVGIYSREEEQDKMPVHALHVYSASATGCGMGALSEHSYSRAVDDATAVSFEWS